MDRSYLQRAGYYEEVGLSVNFDRGFGSEIQFQKLPQKPIRWVLLKVPTF